MSSWQVILLLASLKQVLPKGGWYAVRSFSPEWRGVRRCTGAGRVGVPGGGGGMGWGVCRGLYCASERWCSADLRSLDSTSGDGCWHEAGAIGHLGDATLPATSVEGGSRSGDPGSIVERALHTRGGFRRCR